jgi:hypothetical protein
MKDFISNCFLLIFLFDLLFFNCNEVKNSFRSQRMICKESSPGGKKENFESSCGILVQIFSQPNFDSNNLSSRQESLK